MYCTPFIDCLSFFLFVILKISFLLKSKNVVDQDLPNYVQHHVPIFSLPQEWLWCESWCSNETKSSAKTIDLCNNPLHKEPKVSMAKVRAYKVDILNQSHASFKINFITCFIQLTFESSKLKNRELLAGIYSMKAGLNLMQKSRNTIQNISSEQK